MFETPYQTTPCSRFVLDKTFSGIRRLEINEGLVHPTQCPGGISFVPVGVVDFQPFQQPITRIEIPNLETELVMDGRSILKADGTPNRTDIFQHACLTGQLVKFWYTGDVSAKRDMLNLGDFPAKAFISWMAGAITLRLGLDFGQAAVLRALTAVYYIQLFGPLTAHPTEDEVDRLLSRASRLVPGTDATTLKNTLGDVPALHNLGDYVAWVRKVLNSPRSEMLTVALIYTSLGFSFGVAYREAVAVACEYPPIFIALVYSAVNERSYSKTGLGKVVEKIISRGQDKEFVKNVDHLIKAR